MADPQKIPTLSPVVGHNPFPWVIGLALIITATMVYSLLSGSRMVKRYTPQIDAVMAIKLEASLGHLRFEEVISGDGSQDIAVVMEHLEQSEWYARALLEGGENFEYVFLPVHDSALRREIKLVLAKITEFKGVAEQRWATAGRSGIGTEMDLRFDILFEEILDHTNHVETLLQDELASELRHYYVAKGLLVICCLVLFTFIIYVFKRYERRQSNSIATLRESEERFSLTLDSVSDGGWDWDVPTGKVLYSDRWLESLGYKPDEVTPHISFWESIIHPDDLPHTQEVLNAHFDGLTINYECENRLRTASGEYRWNLDRGKVVSRDDAGRPLRMVGTDTDITVRKKAEESLRYINLQLRQSIDQMPIAYILWDDEFRVVEWNPAAEKIFGYSKSEIVGKYPLNYIVPEPVRPLVYDTIKKLLNGEEASYSGEGNNIRKDGEVISCQWYNTPMKDETGTTVAVLSMAVEITERLQAENELRKLSVAVEQSPAVVVITDTTGKIVYVNPRFTEVTEYTKEEAIGQNPSILKSGNWPKEAYEELWTTILAGKTWRGEFENKKKNGELYWESASISPIRNAQGEVTHFLAVKEDITERMQAEEELKQKTHDLGERLKELNCLYVISKLLEQPDITMEEILQGTVDIIPPSWQYPEVATARITVKDRVYSTSNFSEGQWRQASEIVVNGEPVGYIEVYYVKEKPASDEGPFLKEERSLINVIAEQLGKFIVRTRLEEEREALTQQLQQAQKMEAAAQLAGGVAHDFNNLLTVISGYVSLSKEALPEGHKAIDLLDSVQQTVKQATGVTRSLLTFSHKMETKREQVNLQSIVSRSLNLLRHVLPDYIEVVTDTACEPLWIHADEIQMQQIIMNLAINSRDAMPEGGTLKIAVSKSTSKSRGLAISGERHVPVARLVVSDTGTGIEPDVLDRIYEPFFTTKQRGVGTGLGLAIIHSIVKDHKGHIHAESESGNGTTFTVDFPLLEHDAQPDAFEESTLPTRGKGEVILLAEVNQQVRRILTTTLESLHYEVIPVADGVALMDSFDRHRKRIELLILDVDLPKRNGLDCLSEIRSSGHSVPVIIITGGAEVGLEKQLDKGTILFRKPFQIANFSELVSLTLTKSQQQEQLA